MWLVNESTGPYKNDSDLDPITIFNLFRTRTNELLAAVLQTCDVVQKEVDMFNLVRRTLTFYTDISVQNGKLVLSLHIHPRGFCVRINNTLPDTKKEITYNVMSIDMNYSWICRGSDSMMFREPGYSSYYESFAKKMRECILHRMDINDSVMIGVRNVDMAISHSTNSGQGSIRKRPYVVWSSDDIDDENNDYYPYITGIEPPLQETSIFNDELLYGRDAVLINCATQGIGSFTNCTTVLGMAVRSTEFYQLALNGLKDIENTIWKTISTTEQSSQTSP